MKPSAALAVLLAALTIAGAQDQRIGVQDIIRILAQRHWGENEDWIAQPQDRTETLTANSEELENDYIYENEYENADSDEDLSNGYDNVVLTTDAEKRSALTTALNPGRRRRQPAPAIGKASTQYVSVDVLNDVGSYFNSLRDNLEVLASMSPEERSLLFKKPPHVVQVPSASMSGGGIGMRKLHALRPLRPTSNIRSYNRRSFVEPDRTYPGANHHDPGLLWTGLGRR